MNKEKIIRGIKVLVLQGLKRGEKLPLVLRILLGIAFCIGGLLFFLPVLGIWMLPLGLALIGLCLPGVREKIKAWMARTEAQLHETQ